MDDILLQIIPSWDNSQQSKPNVEKQNGDIRI